MFCNRRPLLLGYRFRRILRAAVFQRHVAVSPRQKELFSRPAAAGRRRCIISLNISKPILFTLAILTSDIA